MISEKIRREASRMGGFPDLSVTGVVLARRVQHQTLDNGALRTSF
ncbi:hypothetical protein [Nostoc sp. 'Peltigera membranacea cyanobiont' 213]|nr:hypothetical protein [Nostoc sp. 'Peltigera membranacea cyanobiont' 213]